MRKTIIGVIYFILFCIFTITGFAQVIPAVWTWPITSDYGPRNAGSTATWFHQGIDYGGPEGANIPAVEAGTISDILYQSGWYISIEGSHGRWAYVHIFSGTSTDLSVPITSGNWDLRTVTLENAETGVTNDSTAIILWTDTTRTSAQKVLCINTYANRRVLIDGTAVLGADSTEIRSQGSVATSESIAPVGTSGGYPAHLHLQLNGGADNPLFYLIHTPDGSPTITIEQPDENHIFEGTELTSNYSIRTDVNSTNGPDVNQITFLIYKNNDSFQIVYLPGAPGEPTFSYTGAVGEYDTSWNTTVLVGSDGNTTGVQPYQVAGDSLGHDKFIYQQNFSDLNLPSGEHSIIVRVTDVNGNSTSSNPRHFTIHDYPIVVSTNPANGAVNVSTDSPITITFNHAMDTASVQGAITVVPALVEPTFTWSNGNKTMTIDDAYVLDANQTYTVTILDSAMDTNSVHLDGDKDGQPGGSYVFSFTTGKQENYDITSFSSDYFDGTQHWVKSGTKSFTVDVFDNNGDPLSTTTPPQITCSSGLVSFTDPGSATSTWNGEVSISGGDGPATFSAENGGTLIGITEFMIDTLPPTLEEVEVNFPACACPSGPIAFQYYATDSGSGVADVVPKGLGLYANGCFAPGEYELGASSITDNVGNTTSIVDSILIPDPPGCDGPDDNFSFNGSSVLPSASND